MVRYTVEDVEKIFGVTFTPEQRAALENMPFSEAVLRECEGTHLLFPTFPLSLLEIRQKFADLFFPKTGGWYAGEAQTFSCASRPVRWHLFRREPVHDSFGKSWDDQRKLLLPEDEVPSSALVAFATMLHFGVTKQRLFESYYVRTSDMDSGGSRVGVGNFAAHGFYISYRYCDGYLDGVLDLSSVRKF